MQGLISNVLYTQIVKITAIKYNTNSGKSYNNNEYLIKLYIDDILMYDLTTKDNIEYINDLLFLEKLTELKSEVEPVNI